MVNKDVSQLVTEMYDFYKIQLEVFCNMSIPILLPWQHTWFQTSTILKYFLITFSVLYSLDNYLLMLPHLHDPVESIKIHLVEFVVLFSVFQT